MKTRANAIPQTHAISLRSQRTAIGEKLLLRFLTSNGIIPTALLSVIEAEHAGAGAPISLLDWLIQRGHVTEEQLTSALSWCVRLTPADLEPYRLEPAAIVSAPRYSRRAPHHLRLVSSRAEPVARAAAPCAADAAGSPGRSASARFRVLRRGAS